MRVRSRTRTETFDCPLRAECLASGECPFPSCADVNRAVARYKSCRSSTTRRKQAYELYRLHLPLVRKTLARFCRTSECHPGECLAEELVGESYPVFCQLLDDYRPSLGIDFLGFASQRLFWRLSRCAQQLEQRIGVPTQSLSDWLTPSQPVDERLFDQLHVSQILSRLDPNDADVVTRLAAGYTYRELSDSMGVSGAALRKRVERARARAQTFAEPL